VQLQELIRHRLMLGLKLLPLSFLKRLIYSIYGIFWNIPTFKSSKIRRGLQKYHLSLELGMPGDELARQKSKYCVLGFRRNHNSIQISDRKSTRLNSSHRCISYAVFCLKKKKPHKHTTLPHHYL